MRKSVKFNLPLIILIVFTTIINAQKVKILIQGDTQKIMDAKNGRQDTFIETMENILTDNVTKDADFILQMGDIVESDADNSDRPSQYEIAKTGWRKLDGKIPYVLNVGNNDNAAEFEVAFPLSRYQAWPSYVDHKNKHRNIAHKFNAGGIDWLVISVAFGADELGWAEDLIKDNPDKSVIIIQHEAGNTTKTMGKKYKNVVMILGGHTASNIDLLTGQNGNKIANIRHCWHNAKLDSYFCVVELDIAAGTLSARYYSTLYGDYGDDPNSELAKSPRDPNGTEATNQFQHPWSWSGFQFDPNNDNSGGGDNDGINDAAYVSQSLIPTTMAPGETADVSVTMKNTGTSTWSKSANIKLGSQSEQGNSNWGFNRVLMNDSDITDPDEEKTFSFTITAPQITGEYKFHWKMLQEGVQWFGEQTASVSVTVEGTGTNIYWDDADDTTGWVTQNTNLLTLNTSDKKQGVASLETTGTGIMEFKKTFTEPWSPSGTGSDTILSFWYYISDPTQFDIPNQVEIRSAGGSDSDEYFWNLDNYVNLVPGWNYVELNIADATKVGNTDLNAINYFKLYRKKKDAAIGVITRIDAIQLKKQNKLSVDQINKNTFKMYPNPVDNNIVTIDLAEFGTNDTFEVAIINMLGQTVYRKTFAQNKIHIETQGILKSSIYIVKIKSGKLTATSKLYVN